MITKYRTEKYVEEELDKALNKVMYICQMHKIPLFISAAIENTDDETVYKNAVYSATSNYINLADDKIRKYMLVTNGYEPVPRREVMDFDIDEVLNEQEDVHE